MFTTAGWSDVDGNSADLRRGVDGECSPEAWCRR